MCEFKPSPSSRALCCSLLLLIALITTGTTLAQTITGNITGTVTDPNGAVIPNATVIAKNTGTGVETPVTTNDSGTYTIRFLPIGQYQVTISASGFVTSQYHPFQL